MAKTASIFSQRLLFFPRTEFKRVVKKHGAKSRSKGFTSWTQFVSMLFCQLAGAESLREICTGLACCLGKLRHLGENALRIQIWTAVISDAGLVRRICSKK